MQIKLFTLFSGIGAPEQGAYRVYGKENVELIGACEWDKFARQSFSALYDIDPGHFHKDVNDLDATQYKGKVDILCGGSPCQSFSIAGLRKGTTEDRGQLIYQYIRVVDECRPPVIIYENVKGITSIDNGNTIKEFVQALRDIGYHCHYAVINTKDYGVPQNRERLFLVGFLDYNLYHRFDFAPKIPLTKRLKDVLEDDVDEKYYLSDKMADDFTPLAGNDIGRTIRCGGGSSCTDKHNWDIIKEPMIAASRGRNKDNPSDRTTGNKVEQRLEVNKNGTSNTITSVQKDNYVVEPKILDLTNDFGEGKPREYTEASPTLRSERHGLGVVQDYRIRKLTTLEVWRLQDFPDEAHNKAKEAGVSNSQLYRQAGNSMSVNVMEMIFNQIEKAKRGETDCLF